MNSYNSRIYIVEKKRCYDYAYVLAEMDLANIDAVCEHTHEQCSFVNLFKYRVDFKSDIPLPKKDAYGCDLKYAYLEDVLNFVKKEIRYEKAMYRNSVWRRLRPLKGMLKGYYNYQFVTELMKDNSFYKPDEYNEVLVVHYGY